MVTANLTNAAGTKLHKSVRKFADRRLISGVLFTDIRSLRDEMRAYGPNRSMRVQRAALMKSRRVVA